MDVDNLHGNSLVSIVDWSHMIRKELNSLVSAGDVDDLAENSWVC